MSNCHNGQLLFRLTRECCREIPRTHSAFSAHVETTVPIFEEKVPAVLAIKQRAASWGNVVVYVRYYPVHSRRSSVSPGCYFSERATQSLKRNNHQVYILARKRERAIPHKASIGLRPSLGALPFTTPSAIPTRVPDISNRVPRRKQRTPRREFPSEQSKICHSAEGAERL